MFTGIIKSTGRVWRFDRAGGIYRLEVKSANFDDADIGGSIAINGACLTLVEKKGDILSFDVMEETVRKSSLSYLNAKDLVNMEDSLRAGSPLGGHFVLGHIDCIGEVRNIRKAAGEFILEVRIPEGFNHLLVEKGSVTVDGISLTVSNVRNDMFSVYIAPHTLKATTLRERIVNSMVNIEFDVLGKYISKSNAKREDRGVTQEFLKEKGFF